MRKFLPIIEELRVAKPCAAEWAAMTGNEEARHCAHCQQNVYNLSELTRAQAEELVRSKNARLCLRYFHRADGTMLLRDGAVAYRPRGLIAAGVAALALAAGASALVRPTEARLEPGFALPPPSAPTVQLERETAVTHEPPPLASVVPPHPPPRRPPPVELERRVFKTAGVPIRLDIDLYETRGR